MRKDYMQIVGFLLILAVLAIGINYCWCQDDVKGQLFINTDAAAIYKSKNRNVKAIELKQQKFQVTVTLTFGKMTLTEAAEIEKRVKKEFKDDSCKIVIRVGECPDCNKPENPLWWYTNGLNNNGRGQLHWNNYDIPVTPWVDDTTVFEKGGELQLKTWLHGDTLEVSDESVIE